METTLEGTDVIETPQDVRARTESPSPAVPAVSPQSRERDLALQIRMTASSLVGIALIHRDPDSETSR